MMSLAEIKGRLRAGPVAWPGGYPIYFITTDGEAISFAGVRKCWCDVVRAHLCRGYARSGYGIIACEINWEDPELYCVEMNERIESAYAED